MSEHPEGVNTDIILKHAIEDAEFMRSASDERILNLAYKHGRLNHLIAPEYPQIANDSEEIDEDF